MNREVKGKNEIKSSIYYLPLDMMTQTTPLPWETVVEMVFNLVLHLLYNLIQSFKSFIQFLRKTLSAKITLTYFALLED